MKKFLFILLFTLLPFLGNTQSGYQTQIHVNWQVVGQASWTTPSWFYCITRSVYKYNGYYYYDVWFTSNSYTWDSYYGKSQWRYTQLEGVKMKFDGLYLNSGYPMSFSFIQNYRPHVFQYASRNPSAKYNISWTNYYAL